MTTVEAYKLLYRARKAGDVTGWPSHLAQHPVGPGMMLGFAELTGWIPDCESLADVVAASDHGMTLLLIGVRSVGDLQCECYRILEVWEAHETRRLAALQN